MRRLMAYGTRVCVEMYSIDYYYCLGSLPRCQAAGLRRIHKQAGDDNIFEQATSHDHDNADNDPSSVALSLFGCSSVWGV